MRMRRDIDHLPTLQQRELERAVAILRAEFEDAIALSTSDWKKAGRILRIVLFGSYARGGWVDDPVSGYKSDFDLLIVVSDPRLTDVAEFWYKAEDRLIADQAIGREVNFIVRSLDDINRALTEGQYFFTDIVKEGIALFEASRAKPFKTAVPMTTEGALEMATDFSDQWLENAHSAFAFFQFGVRDKKLKDAVFMLHQAVERAYHGYLLVHTLYSPPSHNIKFLRSLAEDLEPDLRAVWPRNTREARRRFELLKRAYVEARYSEHYTITVDDLNWLGDCAQALITAVEDACQARIEALKTG